MDKTQQAVDVFNKRASSYQDKYMDQSLYEDTFDLFCLAVDTPHAHLMEVACGPGNVTRCLLRRRPDFRMLCTDLAPEMIKLAAENNPSADFRIMDCRDIDSTGKLYDGLVAGFCFPYLSKEETADFITKAGTVLKPGGVIYISTMEGDYTQSGWATGSSGDNIYIHYHEASYLLEYLSNSGFEILHVIHKDFPQADGTTAPDLIIIARR